MTKKLYFTLVMGAMLLTSCGGGATTSSTPTSTPTTSQPTTIQPTSTVEPTSDPTSILPTSDPTTVEPTSEPTTSVYVELTGMTFVDHKVELALGETYTINPNFVPADASNKNMMYETSDTRVATVVDGVVSAVGYGTATITGVTSEGNYRDELEVTIKGQDLNVKTINIDPKFNLVIGETLQLEPEILPVTAIDKTVTYKSLNESIVKVNEQGLLTAIKEGVVTVEIKANGGDVKTSTEVTVSDFSKDFEAGKLFGTASKGFTPINGGFSIESYNEADYTYAKYTKYSGRKWYIEAKVSNVSNNLTDGDIHNAIADWWCPPIGLAGVNDLGINSFGPLAYGQFNAYDNYLVLKDGNRTGVSGTYINFGRNIGGTGLNVMCDLQNGFKIAILRDGNTFFYLVNDVYVGYNNKWVGDGMWDDDSPAIMTYKSGATYSAIKVLTGDEISQFTGKFYTNYDKVQAMFNTYYGDEYIWDSKLFKDTVDGGLMLTDNDVNYIVPTTFNGNTFYFEATIDINTNSFADWVRDGQFPWVGIGVGHVGYYANEERAMAPVPVFNQKEENTTYKTKQLNYIATPVSYEWQKIQVTDEFLANLTTTYKAAILREKNKVYYYINDTLVLTDANDWNFDRNKENGTVPMIYNLWGGTAKVSNISLVTNADEVKAIRESHEVAPELPTPSKAKVIFLSGQSNAEGHTPISDCTYKQLNESITDSKRIQINYTNSYMGNNSNGYKYMDFGYGRDTTCFGPEVGLSKELAERDPYTNYYIIKVAEGSSDLANLWKAPNGRLCKSLISKANECFEYFKQHNVEFTVEGLCWMQGEADACTGSYANHYYDNTENLYNYLCEQWEEYIPETGFKWLDAGISDVWSMYTTVNTAKYEFSVDYDDAIYIDTISSGLTTRTEDRYHYTGTSQLKLGKLFADAYLDSIQ